MIKNSLNDKWSWLTILMFFLILASITFRCTWPSDTAFSASDLNFGRLAAMKNALPESLIGNFGSNQIIGSSGHNLSLFKILLFLIPLELFANLIYPFILILGSISMVWFLRIWGCGWISAVFGALVSFWFNSILLASAGHAYKMEVLAFSVLSLALIEKSIRSINLRRSFIFSLLSGLSIGIMMIEQQDVALIAGLFIVPYLVFRLIQKKVKIKNLGVILIPMILISFSLSGHTILNSYEKNIIDASVIQEDENQKWNYITQWSMVPNELSDLIALGWSGWNSSHPTEPYWGSIGQSPGYMQTGKGFLNFRLDNSYIGIIPFGFAILAFFYLWKSENKGLMLFWLISAILALLLALGKYSFLYEWFYKLPIVSNIRAPIKFLDNMQLAIGILSGLSVNALLNNKSSFNKIHKSGLIGWIIISVISFLVSLKYLLYPDIWTSYFKSIGFSDYATVLLNQMSNSFKHVSILSLISGFVFCLVYLKRFALAGIILLVTLSIDSIILTSKYFSANNVANIKEGNIVINFLKENQKNERSVFVDENGIYNRWLASDGPYHNLNLFNIWQMPRIPKEYNNYLNIVGKNRFRLWELSSVRYLCLPEYMYKQIQQNQEFADKFELKLRYQISTQGGIRDDVILKSNQTIPRFALYKNWEVISYEKHCNELVNLNHNPKKSLFVTPKSGLSSIKGNQDALELNAILSKRKAKLFINTDSDSIIRFSQRYQPGWKVFINGNQVPLLRVDYLSMGVFVPPGSNEVIFVCNTQEKPVIFCGTIILFVIGCLSWNHLYEKKNSFLNLGK